MENGLCTLWFWLSTRLLAQASETLIVLGPNYYIPVSEENAIVTCAFEDFAYACLAMAVAMFTGYVLSYLPT